MTEVPDLSISYSLERLALALGEAGAVPRSELIHALERAAERLRDRAPVAVIPTDVLSQAEAARVIGVSRQAVNQWVQKGILRTYVTEAANGRRAALVSLAEISVAANRWRPEPFSASLRRELDSFLQALGAEPTLARLADSIGTRLADGPSSDSGDDAARVLREFLIAAMGTAGRQQEFTPAGVKMLSELRPALLVDPQSGSGQLLDALDLLIHSADGSAGFDSPSTAFLGLLGAATVGSRLDHPESRTADFVATAARQTWGEDWVRRMFDAAYQSAELVSPPLTRYTAPLVYLGCNHFMRQAQASGVSITYAASPGAVLPQSYHGAPVLSEMLAGHRRATPAWEFKKGSDVVRSALHRSAKSPFRIFNFEYGLFDDSIHGLRRYCFSMSHARAELRAFGDLLPRANRASYIELAIETLAHVLEKPFVEMTAIEAPASFDWWKDHIIRSSPQQMLIGLRGAKARDIAHGLLVRASVLPQILESGAEDAELRERLRVYVKNLSYDITDERYRDDLSRGTARLIKAGAEQLTADEALTRAESELRHMTGP